MRGLVSAVILSVLAVGAVGMAQAQVPVTATRVAYTIEPFAPSAPITIQGTGVRLRAEPFATPQTQVLSSGSTGLQLNVVGLARLPDWNWYQVVLNNGQKAFIRSDFTSAPSRGSPAGSSVPYATSAPVAPVAPVALPPIPVRPAPAPVYLPPVYPPPASTPASTQPDGSGEAPISLIPRSPAPEADASDPSGLLSRPPE